MRPPGSVDPAGQDDPGGPNGPAGQDGSVDHGRDRRTAQPKPPERSLRYTPRSDGGFGPMGSSAAPAAAGPPPRDPVEHSAEEHAEERRGSVEFRSGAGYRPEEAEGAAPQFLIEADEPFDEGGAERRLAAPPVLGEAPTGYRDF